MFDDLEIIHWPDPRLLKISKPVTVFDDTLAALARRMLQLMRESKGVGLAAPQVGKNLRLFVMNDTQEPDGDRVYVNPVLCDAEGEQEAEEGCLSLPGINVNVLRSNKLRLTARDLRGHPLEEIGTGYIARIWQHETDHLNGVLLTDRMGAVAKLANRRVLKNLEEEYREQHAPALARTRKR